MSRLFHACLLVLPMLAVAAVIWWAAESFALAPLRGADTAIAELLGQVVDLRQRRHSAEAAVGRVRENNNPTGGAGLVLASANAAASAAVAQEHVRRLVATAGGVLLSSQATTGELTESTARVQVIVRARLSEDGVLELMQQLENGSPRIVVAGLELRPTRAGDYQAPLEFAAVLTMVHADAP